MVEQIKHGLDSHSQYFGVVTRILEFLIKLTWYVCRLQPLRRFPTLQAALVTAANEALERFREDGRTTTLRLVDMEAGYLTVEFFRKLPQDPDGSKVGDPSADSASVDRYGDGHYRNIASNVSQYIKMAGDELLQKIPKAVVYCQVREAKRSLLDNFYVQIGKKEVCTLDLVVCTHAHAIVA